MKFWFNILFLFFPIYFLITKVSKLCHFSNMKNCFNLFNQFILITDYFSQLTYYFIFVLIIIIIMSTRNFLSNTLKNNFDVPNLKKIHIYFYFLLFLFSSIHGSIQIYFYIKYKKEYSFFELIQSYLSGILLFFSFFVYFFFYFIIMITNNLKIKEIFNKTHFISFTIVSLLFFLHTSHYFILILYGIYLVNYRNNYISFKKINYYIENNELNLYFYPDNLIFDKSNYYVKLIINNLKYNLTIIPLKNSNILKIKTSNKLIINEINKSEVIRNQELLNDIFLPKSSEVVTRLKLSDISIYGPFCSNNFYLDHKNIVFFLNKNSMSIYESYYNMKALDHEHICFKHTSKTLLTIDTNIKMSNYYKINNYVKINSIFLVILIKKILQNDYEILICDDYIFKKLLKNKKQLEKIQTNIYDKIHIEIFN